MARSSGSNFFLAFRTLPSEMYQQMCALYAFMRYTDDISDQSGLTLQQRADLLLNWRHDLTSEFAGTRSNSLILPALVDLAKKRQIPPEYLFEVINGVESDLRPRTFQTFEELEHYCYQVAGVVGLCCLKIWGYNGDAALQPAIACGTAFQLTNVLRDLKEDSQRGRYYLPMSELADCGYSTQELRTSVRNAAFRELMQAQVDRAWCYYRDALPLQSYLTPPGRRIFLAFFDLYSSLLYEIERVEFDVFSKRIRLSRFKKASVALRCLLRMGSRQHLVKSLSR